ncbi:hypothetical protein, partial [Mesorhizobium sp.]|uniref:hypothetical protein n=1 Tax=Mesorhizobium sp. TaxID=1871066 RepID=UPI00257E2C9D
DIKRRVGGVFGLHGCAPIQLGAGATRFERICSGELRDGLVRLLAEANHYVATYQRQLCAHVGR